MSCIKQGALISAKTDPLPGSNYPRIGWDNHLPNNANANSDDANTSLAPNLLTYSTWDKFVSVGGSPTVVLITPINSFTADYIAIAGHNLRDVSGSITVEVDDGGGFVTVGTINSTSRSTARLFEFAEITPVAIRLTLTGGGSLPVSISNVFCGKVMVMERPNYAGVAPSSLASKTTYSPTSSDGGQFLGRQLIRKGVDQSASFRHLSEAWMRSEFDSFIEHAQLLPFFYAWNQEEDPTGVVYGWSGADIIPVKMGVTDLLEVSFEITGHR